MSAPTPAALLACIDAIESANIPGMAIVGKPREMARKGPGFSIDFRWPDCGVELGIGTGSGQVYFTFPGVTCSGKEAAMAIASWTPIVALAVKCEGILAAPPDGARGSGT